MTERCKKKKSKLTSDTILRRLKFKQELQTRNTMIQSSLVVEVSKLFTTITVGDIHEILILLTCSL